MTAIGDALKSRAVVGALFLELMLDAGDGGPLRAFSGVGSWTDPGGLVWRGTYGLGRLSPVQTSEGVTANAFQASFSASLKDAASPVSWEQLVAAIRADRTVAVKGKRVRALMGVFDQASGALVGNRLVQWASGVGSHLTTHWAPGFIGMTLNCEPRIGAAWPSKGRMLSHEDQQLIWQGDMGLEFVSVIASGGRNVVWNPGV